MTYLFLLLSLENIVFKITYVFLDKAPPKLSDVQLPTGSFSFVSIVNKTEATLFLLNPRDEYIKEVLPASEGLILFSKPKETLEYEIDFDGKNVKRFSLIVQKTNENWKLKVDWHDMLEMPGYRFKPVSSSDEWLELTSTKKDCVEILLEKELKKL